MKIIADPETGGLQTSCLMINWGLSRTCQAESPESLIVTICKKHYDKGKAEGKIKWQFDNVQ